jgi:hypothetical protein
MNYTIIPDKKLILECYSGIISVHDLIKNKINVSKDKLYDPAFNIIHDMRDAELLISEDEGRNFYNFIKSYKTTQVKRRVAHLTQTPHQVAVTTQFSFMVDENLFETNTFSTLKAALIWVKLSIDDFDLIESCLKEIRKDKPA